jgi:hypothetical protein
LDWVGFSREYILRENLNSKGLLGKVTCERQREKPGETRINQEEPSAHDACALG